MTRIARGTDPAPNRRDRLQREAITPLRLVPPATIVAEPVAVEPTTPVVIESVVVAQPSVIVEGLPVEDGRAANRIATEPTAKLVMAQPAEAGGRAVNRIDTEPTAKLAAPVLQPSVIVAMAIEPPVITPVLVDPIAHFTDEEEAFFAAGDNLLED